MSWSWSVVLALVLLAAAPWFPASAQPATFDTFASQVSPGEVVPGADRFGPTQQSPPVAQVFRGDQLVGYAYLNSQYVNADGYSSKPIHIMVGLDTAGTIVGIKMVAHSEPIVLIGIPEKRVIDYMSAFIGYNPLKAAAEGSGPPKVNLVSGATVTALVMGESITRSAVRVARLLGLGGEGGAVNQAAARSIDTGAGEITSWQGLLEEGGVKHLHLTVGDVNRKFLEGGDPAAARFPQAGGDDDPFIDLYVALVSQPAIGRSLLGESEYASMQQMLSPDQQAILVAGDGIYSFKGSGYVRGGIFDRIELVQGAETIRFRDQFHRRVGAIAADGAPPLKEIGIFVIPEGSEFDPAAPWRLQLLVQRSTGALTKVFESFDLPYTIPARYTQSAAPASGEGAATAAVAAGASAPGAQPGQAGPADASQWMVDEGDDDPLWKRVWQSKVVAIAMLGIMLGVLTLIFFFQDALVKHEKLFDRVRLAYLATTLFWLGWVAQAQLSVVNVLTFASSLRSGFNWSSFLIDPLIFILWCSVAVSLLFWGRGAFCGWLCPFGALQELSNRIAKALKVPQLKIPWAIHERLWPIKYIIFLALFAVSLGSLAFAEQLAEVEPFKTAIILHFLREWWFVLFAVSLIVAGLFVERFFCRYMCPLGAALAIPGRMRMFNWLKRYRECGNPCMRCFKECPVEAIHPEGHINPNECIQCLHCQVLYHSEQKCPVKIQRRLKREKREAFAQRIPIAVLPDKDGPEPQPDPAS
ncbi:regulatory protein NosR [Lysobacter sp. H21R4]|uniref:NosR/NirI family protein n=1 Tax=Lysobacter sp. H21R4 TaxID=2781021 RepID=UPI001887FAA9|nr:NosR/NirI family protein [Lysobacter sp. H21R4]QOY63729.1 regulatory protein NosR [Lysobacter sp. H21R4]